MNIDESTIRQWVNHADLFPLHGVRSEYSDLFEAAEIDTVPELRHRNAAGLYDTLVKTSETMKLVRRLPSPAQVVDWVEKAKTLPRGVEYQARYNKRNGATHEQRKKEEPVR